MRSKGWQVKEVFVATSEMIMYIYYIRILNIPRLFYSNRSVSLWRTGTCMGLILKCLKGRFKNLWWAKCLNLFLWFRITLSCLSNDCLFLIIPLWAIQVDSALIFKMCKTGHAVALRAMRNDVTLERWCRMYGTCSLLVLTNIPSFNGEVWHSEVFHYYGPFIHSSKQHEHAQPALFYFNISWGFFL